MFYLMFIVKIIVIFPSIQIIFLYKSYENKRDQVINRKCIDVLFCKEHANFI